MSHRTIAIPINVEHVERPGKLRAVSMRDFLKAPETAEFRFIETPEASPNGPFDAWKLRDDFLAWPLQDWEAFVLMAGHFAPFRISQSKFERWQKLLREALIRPAREWKGLEDEMGLLDPFLRLSGPLHITFEWGGTVPTARIRSGSTLTAIIATIQIDKLQGAEFRVCARHDCKTAPFRVEARQKIYCSSDCAHLVAVRRSRAGEASSKKATNRKHR